MLRRLLVKPQLIKINHQSLWNIQLNSVSFKFINKDNSVTEVTAEVGESVLDIAKHNDVDLEGACEASCACSTCHVILDQKLFDSLPDAEDEEEDMLDLAFALT